MSAIRILQIDAFTDRPFAGNPAAVCLLEEEADPEWMQSLANEMNLSETAFVRKLDDGFELRWFTPGIEVDLCGHATLASAHALWNEHIVDSSEIIRFHTKSGLLSCKQESRNAGEFIELDFPATPAEEVEPPTDLLAALGIASSVFVGRSIFDQLIVLADEESVRELRPNFDDLRNFEIRGLIVTGPANDLKVDFVSRYFAPAAGINEDPVTGSAHCCLGPYWSEQLQKTELVAYQASKRGGTVGVKVAGDRVFLSGQAVTVMKGELV